MVLFMDKYYYIVLVMSMICGCEREIVDLCFMLTK